MHAAEVLYSEASVFYHALPVCRYLAPIICTERGGAADDITRPHHGVLSMHVLSL